MLGSVGAAIGSSMEVKGGQSMLALVDNRSGVQVAVAEGSSSGMDIGGLMGLLGGRGGGALGAYTRTPEGKVVVASMADAFNNLVVAVKNYQAQEATGPHGMAPAASSRSTEAAAALSSSKTAGPADASAG